MRESTTTPRILGWSAAASALLLGGAHLVITGNAALTGASAPTPGALLWILLPALTALLPAVAAVVLARSGGRRTRWPLWTSGITAVLSTALAVMGLTPLAFGADPLSLFLGPGPYALVCAVLFIALTLSSVRRRPHREAPKNGRTHV